MYSFILITHSFCTAAGAFDFIKHLGPVRCEPGNRYVVEAPGGMRNGWLAIQPVENGEGEYEQGEILKIKRNIPDPRFFIVEGRDEMDASFRDRFVLGLDDSVLMMIDNDHGLIESVKCIKKMILSNIEWLYQSE